MKEPKRLYYILATLATAAAAAAGGAILSDGPIVGSYSTPNFEMTFDMPVSIERTVELFLSGGPCAHIRAQGGACDPATIDFNAVFRRYRGNSRDVWRFAHYAAYRRSPIPTPQLGWLQGRLNEFVCPRIENRYGANACNVGQNDFAVWFIRKRGRAIVRVKMVISLFCSQLPPTEPTESQL